MTKEYEIMKKDKIKIEGHVGTWYVIDHTTCARYGDVYLLEHETYGDEAACLIIDKDYNVILDDVWNGFDDLWEWLDFVEEWRREGK